MHDSSSPPHADLVDLVEQARRALAPRFRGALLGPADAGYHDARSFWNGKFDRKPGLIARCAGPADVMDVVSFARRREIPLSVRSGTHDFGGYSVVDGGITIDLSRMKGLRIDPERRTGCAEAGVLWREFTREAQAFGLAACGAVNPDITVTGYGIGGGQNLMQRRFGLGCDNIISLDLVTADGHLVTACEDEHPDLFWAMRGAGANFGVVTSVEYRLHPVETVLGGTLVYALGGYDSERAQALLGEIRDHLASAPEELMTIIYLIDDPAHGPSITLVLCCLTTGAEGEAILRPLRELGPTVDKVAPVSYEEVQNILDSRVLKGIRYYNKCHFLPRLDDGAAKLLCDAYAERGASGFCVLLEPMDGAVRRVPPLATAYPERTADYCALLMGIWMDPAQTEKSIGQVREVSAALAPLSTGRAYVNYLDDDERERVPTAYGQEIYERLRAVKKRYDPTNLFRENQNIPPAP